MLLFLHARAPIRVHVRAATIFARVDLRYYAVRDRASGVMMMQVLGIMNRASFSGWSWPLVVEVRGVASLNKGGRKKQDLRNESE